MQADLGKLEAMGVEHAGPPLREVIDGVLRAGIVCFKDPVDAVLALSPRAQHCGSSTVAR